MHKKTNDLYNHKEALLIDGDGICASIYGDGICASIYNSKLVLESYFSLIDDFRPL